MSKLPGRFQHAAEGQHRCPTGSHDHAWPLKRGQFKLAELSVEKAHWASKGEHGKEKRMTIANHFVVLIITENVSLS